MRIDETAVLDNASIGMAIVGSGGILRWVNRAGALVLGAPVERLVGHPSPFVFTHTDGSPTVDEEHLAQWVGDCGLRHISYQVGGPVAEGRVVSFRDETPVVHQRHRLAALSRAATGVALDHPLGEVLEAMAREIQESDGVAATQIISTAPLTDRLQVMGAAGFADVGTFFDILMACHERGAALATYEAMESMRQVVRPQRRRQMLLDPTWAPMHPYISQIEWSDFVASPLIVRDGSIGVLNVYLEVGYSPDHSALDFFAQMAERAAAAIDHAHLLARDRVAVQQEERQRLGRDLHDSVVQQLFSVSLQAGALTALSTRLSGGTAGAVADIAAETNDLVQSALADLRAIVRSRARVLTPGRGLVAGLEELVTAVRRRTGTDVRLDVSIDETGIALDWLEDAYQIASEALHNAVKHAQPTTVLVSVTSEDADPGQLVIRVSDDGSWRQAHPRQPGFGIRSMRDRARRWGGDLRVQPSVDGAATTVTLRMPLASGRSTYEESHP